MFSEMKIAGLLQKVDTLNPKALPTRQTFNMATINGAKALGINAGLIKEDKLADIVLVNTLTPNMVPLRNPLTNIVYSALGNDVDTVICDGKILMQDKQLTTINENEIIEDIQIAAKEL